MNKPYFAIFQQIDVILQDFDETVCSNKSTVDFNSELGIPKCSWLIVFVFVVYIIVICIMLINLLIATFSNTFNTVEKDARKTWLYYRFEIIMEYVEKPALVPPLTTISYLLKFINFLHKKCNHNTNRVSEDFNEETDYNKQVENSKLEKEGMKKYEESVDKNPGNREKYRNYKIGDCYYETNNTTGGRGIR